MCVEADTVPVSSITPTEVSAEARAESFESCGFGEAGRLRSEHEQGCDGRVWSRK